MEVNVNYHTHGRLLIEISRDGQTWLPLATQADVGTAAVDLPADVLPAPGCGCDCGARMPRANLQVNRVQFSGRLSGAVPDAYGRNRLCRPGSLADELAIESMQRRRDASTGNELLQVRVRNASQRVLRIGLAMGAAAADIGSPVQEVPPGQACQLESPLPRCGPESRPSSFGSPRQKARRFRAK